MAQPFNGLVFPVTVTNRPQPPSLPAPICPTCGRESELVDDRAVYGSTSYGRVWLCPTKACDARVGAHADGRPKGTLAGPALRRARMRAHGAFDGWWMAAGLARRRAYAVLAERMGLEVAHIGEMDEAQCARVVQLFTAEAVR